MKLSTRSKYGLRFLIYLGLKHGEGYVLLKDIAEQEAIPLKYLEQIVRRLKPAGILQVSRGAKGGYALAIKPSEVKMQQIYQLLEGALRVYPKLLPAILRKCLCKR